MQIQSNEAFTVDALSERLQTPRAHVITAARRLQARGKGRFIVGRKGHPSRYEPFTDDAAPLAAPPASPTHVAVRSDLVVTVPGLSAEEKIAFLRALQALWASS